MSLHGYCVLMYNFVACRNPRPIALFRLRRDGRNALRLPSHSEQTRKEEKEIDHLPNSRFLSDSFKECSALSNSFNNAFGVFCAVPRCSI